VELLPRGARAGQRRGIDFGVSKDVHHLRRAPRQGVGPHAERGRGAEGQSTRENAKRPDTERPDAKKTRSGDLRAWTWGLPRRMCPSWTTRDAGSRSSSGSVTLQPPPPPRASARQRAARPAAPVRSCRSSAAGLGGPGGSTGARRLARVSGRPARERHRKTWLTRAEWASPATVAAHARFTRCVSVAPRLPGPTLGARSSAGAAPPAPPPPPPARAGSSASPNSSVSGLRPTRAALSGAQRRAPTADRAGGRRGRCRHQVRQGRGPREHLGDQGGEKVSRRAACLGVGHRDLPSPAALRALRACSARQGQADSPEAGRWKRPCGAETHGGEQD